MQTRQGEETGMPVYLIADIAIRDAAAFEEYRAKVAPMVAAHGGRYLIRGGAIEVLEGTPDYARLTVIEFPDHATAKRFHDSADYAPLLQLRTAATDSKVVLIEGYAG